MLSTRTTQRVALSRTCSARCPARPELIAAGGLRATGNPRKPYRTARGSLAFAPGH